MRYEKVFVITGANRGLGKAFVDIVIQNENHLVISISRSKDEALKEHAPENFFFLRTDLSDNTVGKKIRVLKDLIENQQVYYINNASTIEPIATVADLTEVDMDTAVSINIKSPLVIINYLLRQFGHNDLTFVNISSGAANRAISNWSLYCASKAFVNMFFNVAESEYEQHRFFNIDPGVMDTRMQESIRASDFPEVAGFKLLAEEGKLKSPKDVALDILNTIL